MKKETKQDNAFAWLVLLAAFAQGFIERAINRSPTVFNIEWREYFEADYTQVLAISATFDATACFGAMIFAPLTLRYGCRKMAFVGGLVTSLGLLLSVFAFSVECFYVSFGLIGGTGLALGYMGPVASVQYFFNKYRPLAVGIAVGGKSAGGFLSTPLLRLAIDYFGWRGAMLLLVGVSMQLMVCSMFYRPFDLDSIKKSTVKDETMNGRDDDIGEHENTQIGYKQEKSLFEDSKVVAQSCDLDFGEEQNGANDPLYSTKTGQFRSHHDEKVRAKSTQKISTKDKTEIKTYHFARETEPSLSITKRFMKWINAQYNYKLFLEYTFSAFILGVTLLQFTTAVIPGVVPLKAVHDGHSKMAAAFLTSALDITTFCSIIVTGFLANAGCINRTIMYGTVICLYSVMGIGICFTWNYASLLVTVVFAGVFYGCDRALINTVMGDIVGVTRITQAKAWDMGTSTVAFATALPFAGCLIDVTGSHNVPLFTLCSLGVIGGAIILTIPVYEKLKKKQTVKS